MPHYLFIDAENISQKILTLAISFGKSYKAEAFAYCSKEWKIGKNSVIKKILDFHNIPIIHAPTSGENSADMCLIAHSVQKCENTGLMILASSDADLKIIPHFFKTHGAKTIGFGTKTAKNDYKDMFDIFVEVSPEETSLYQKTETFTETPIKTATKLLKTAYKKSKRRKNGWIHAGLLGEYYHSLGGKYNGKFTEFLKKFPIFESQPNQNYGQSYRLKT